MHSRPTCFETMDFLFEFSIFIHWKSYREDFPRQFVDFIGRTDWVRVQFREIDQFSSKSTLNQCWIASEVIVHGVKWKEYKKISEWLVTFTSSFLN